jgi:hypothetical protein
MRRAGPDLICATLDARRCLGPGLLGLTLLFAQTPLLAGAPPSASIVVQHAPLAGFVYYDGPEVWDRMKKGDRLTLVREPGNSHDANAIRLEWQGRPIGYVPRRDNADLARQMDLGARVEARVTELTRHANGRRRISYIIHVPLN